MSGRAVFEALQQSAGRRAVLRDREAFPAFLDAVRAVEPVVAQAVAKVAREVDEQTAGRVADQLRRIFDRVLKELADLDNPMRSLLGDEPGEGALLSPLGESAPSPNGSGGSPQPSVPPLDLPDLPELSDPSATSAGAPPPPARPDRRRSSDLPSVAPDPQPGELRSRLDAEAGVVFYNDHHPDYLTVKDDEAALLDYLATLVAKEYVLHNNPRASNDDFAEEMVRMLVCVRRDLPRRR